MDPQQLAAALASGDRNQIIAAQRQLQASGYNVKPDGRLGSETSRAVAAYKEEFDRKAATAQAQAANESKARETEANARLAEAKAKEAEQDPTNRLVKLGTEVAPYVVGVGSGLYTGHKFSTAFKAGDEASREQINRLAAARGINSTIKESELNKLLTRRNVRNAAQFAAPGLLAGGAVLTRDVIAPSFSDPTTRDIINSVGTGENAAALTLGVHQAVDTVRNIGKGADIVDVARIRSHANPEVPASSARPVQMLGDVEPAHTTPPDNQIPHPVSASRPPDSQIPDPDVAASTVKPATTSASAAAEEPMRHSDRLKLAVTAAGGKPSVKKADNVAAIRKNLTADNMPSVAQSLKLPADASRASVLQRLREISSVGGKLALPLAAGALAYDAATQPSEAADGTLSAPSVGTGLAAAGTAAGTIAGANKLLSMIPRGAGSMLGDLNAPGMIDQLTDIPQGDVNDIRNKLARNLPSWMRVGAIKDAADMSQVPDPSPMRAAPGNQNYPLSGQLQAENLPMPDESMVHAPADTQPQDFDSHLADLQRLFAQIDAEDQATPSAPQMAAQSAQVAQMPPQPIFAPMPQNALLQASR